MQDVTDLPFMKVVAKRGGPDYFVTEYFRVYENSKLNSKILQSITENETGIPVYAQMIGQDIPALVHIAKELQNHPVAGIDLNLGCPAPKVCNKQAGGGLLRHPDKIDQILGALREACACPFTVKTRLGYEAPEEIDLLLSVFEKHAIDALVIHGRTVREKYQTPVHPDLLRRAVERLNCPVMANGNVVNVETGLAYLEQTQAAGLMIGRGAIRSPWIFSQLRAHWEGREKIQPTKRDLFDYVMDLYEEAMSFHGIAEERLHVNKMKKYMVYLVQGLDEDLEYQMRRAKLKSELMGILEDFLGNDEKLPDLPPENSRLFCGFSDLLSSS